MNFKGKSVEEAISNALETLGVTREELDITILNEASKGILGLGQKEAKIDVSLKETSIADLIDQTINNFEVRSQENLEPLTEVSRGPVKETSEGVVASKDKVDKALTFLKELLGKMGYECEYFIRLEQGFTIINIRGKNASKLIGKRGETLYALQYLVNIVANRNDDSNVKLLLDVEDFRKQREKTLTSLAIKLAGQVRESGDSISLEPMNPLERKIIHMALQKELDILTTSDGEEGRRHIVISLKAQN